MTYIWGTTTVNGHLQEFQRSADFVISQPDPQWGNMAWSRPGTLEKRDYSNAAGFPELVLMQPLPRNEPKVDPGANQVSQPEIKAV